MPMGGRSVEYGAVLIHTKCHIKAGFAIQDTVIVGDKGKHRGHLVHKAVEAKIKFNAVRLEIVDPHIVLDGQGFFVINPFSILKNTAVKTGIRLNAFEGSNVGSNIKSRLKVKIHKHARFSGLVTAGLDGTGFGLGFFLGFLFGLCLGGRRLGFAFLCLLSAAASYKC